LIGPEADRSFGPVSIGGGGGQEQEGSFSEGGGGDDKETAGTATQRKSPGAPQHRTAPHRTGRRSRRVTLHS
jgi:hypothetical protein